MSRNTARSRGPARLHLINFYYKLIRQYNALSLLWAVGYFSHHENLSFTVFVPRDYTRLIEPTLSRPPDGNNFRHLMQHGGGRNRAYYNSTLRGFRISGSFDFAALLVWNLSIFGSQVSSPSWTKTMAFLGKYPRNKKVWRRTRYDV